MCTSLALSQLQQPYCKVTLIGDIIEKTGSELTLELVRHSFDGQNEYRDAIPVVLDEAAGGKLKVGDRVELWGTTGQFDKKTKVFATQAKKVAKNTPTENLAEAVGRVAQKATSPATADSRAAGNMLLEAGEGFLMRIAFFRGLVNFVERRIPEDGTIRVVGFLRNYQNPNAPEYEPRLELDANPRQNYKGKRADGAGITLLGRPETVNAFAAYSPIASPVKEAAAEQTAEDPVS